MYDLKACMVCLSTDLKLYNMSSSRLRQEYNLVSGLQVSVGSGMPNYLCYVCTAYVRRFKKFRDKCHRTHYLLQEILERNKEINESHINNLNCEYLDIAPTLSYIDTNISHYHETKFQWTKLNRSGIKGERIPTVQYNTVTNSDSFTNTANVEIEINENNIKTDTEEFLKQLPDNTEDVTHLPTSKIELTDLFLDNDNDSDNGQDGIEVFTHTPCKVEKDEDVDGSVLDEEYATMVPISSKEAKAAVEVYRMFSTGKYKCRVCGKGYSNENRLNIHMRMHDMHVSGSFLCELCNYYYKTDFLLTTHVTQKHMYKYLCKKCPEVNFDRTSAKQHYIWTHLQKGEKKNANWYETRPNWLSTKGGKRVKGVVSLRPVRKLKKLPEDFLIYSPIGHEEQYTLVLDRQKSRNYKDAKYRCHLCFRGFQVMTTYNNHMKKHDPAVAGPLECDVCRVRFRNQRKMYKHMIITHLFKYSCQLCSYVCYNRGQAHMHYRWHKNVTYKCPHCDKEFKKMSTRLTHIRIKHPSMNICPMCGHSFVSETGLYHHKLIVHTQEEIELINNRSTSTAGPHYCAECDIQFMNESAFSTHLGSSNKHAVTNLSIQASTRVKSAEQRANTQQRRHHAHHMRSVRRVAAERRASAPPLRGGAPRHRVPQAVHVRRVRTHHAAIRKPDGSHANPHPRETLRLPGVRAPLQHAQQPGQAHGGTHRRETLPVPALQPSLHTEHRRQAAHTNCAPQDTVRALGQEEQEATQGGRGRRRRRRPRARARRRVRAALAQETHVRTTRRLLERLYYVQRRLILR